MELHFNTRSKNQILGLIEFSESSGLTRETKILLAKEGIEKNYQFRLKNQKSTSKIKLKEGD